MAHDCIAELLESRRLFAGSFISAGTLVVNGQPNQQNTITVGLTPGGTSIIATVEFQTRAGLQTKSSVYLRPLVKRVRINGGNQADLITIDQTSGSFPARATILAGAGNDTVFGGDEPDIIRGNAGSDLLDGGANDDKIVGGYGNDTMVGGLGDDTMRGNMGRDAEFGGEGNDRLIDFGRRQTLLGGDGVDTFVVQGIKRDTNDFDKTIDKIHRVTFPPAASTSLFANIFPFNLFL